MTSRERIEATLRHQQPDRTPVFEYVLLSPLADRLLQRPYAADGANWTTVVHEKGWENAVRQNALDRLELALMLGHDMMYVVPTPPSTAKAQPGDKAPPAPGSPDDPVERVRQRNERQENTPARHDSCLLIYHLLREEMDRCGVDLPILAPAYAHGIWTDTDLMETMLLAPEIACRHFSLATARTLALIDRYVDVDIDQIGVGGDFSGTRPMISPEAYRTFIMPEVRTLSRHIHHAGRYAVNASDGNLWPVIDEFLFGCEVDGYLEIDRFAGMDMRRLRECCHTRVTLYGNLDCGNTLSFGTPQQVREHTIDCIEAGMGSGHILCASNAITASVPLENYLAVVNAYRDVFNLPTFDPGFHI